MCPSFRSNSFMRNWISVVRANSLDDRKILCSRNWTQRRIVWGKEMFQQSPNWSNQKFTSFNWTERDKLYLELILLQPLHIYYIFDLHLCVMNFRFCFVLWKMEKDTYTTHSPSLDIRLAIRGMPCVLWALHLRKDQRLFLLNNCIFSLNKINDRLIGSHRNACEYLHWINWMLF